MKRVILSTLAAGVLFLGIGGQVGRVSEESKTTSICDAEVLFAENNCNNSNCVPPGCTRRADGCPGACTPGGCSK